MTHSPSTEARPKVLILGAGAVGLGLASALMAGGARVALLARAATAVALRDHGLRRSGIFGEVTHQPSGFSTGEDLSDLLRGFGAPTHVLVCVKSFDTAQAIGLLAEVSPALGGATLVLCQNGWGNAEIAARRFEPRRLYNARIITGFRRPQPHQVEITVHAHPVAVGSLYHSETAEVDPLVRTLVAGGLPTVGTPTIGRDLWAKLLYNAALNPLGAILRVPYGALGEREPTRSIMEEVVREAWAVMLAARHETHWPTPEAFLEAFYREQLPPTARHRSSTLQDIEAGRRTEIDALNGVIVRLGAELGIPTPVNETLVRIVGAMETQPPQVNHRDAEAQS